MKAILLPASPAQLFFPKVPVPADQHLGLGRPLRDANPC